uniref:Uncharacterized protein n=1 Tax=Nothobranchius furzeri TaxID=105023 RepID=A0A8C6NZ10_NOTFU
TAAARESWELLDCYTVQGLELSRVTVVNSDLQVIYDTFVRPNNDNRSSDAGVGLGQSRFAAAAVHVFVVLLKCFIK